MFTAGKINFRVAWPYQMYPKQISFASLSLGGKPLSFFRSRLGLGLLPARTPRFWVQPLPQPKARTQRPGSLDGGPPKGCLISAPWAHLIARLITPPGPV